MGMLVLCTMCILRIHAMRVSDEEKPGSSGCGRAFTRLHRFLTRILPACALAYFVKSLAVPTDASTLVLPVLPCGTQIHEFGETVEVQQTDVAIFQKLVLRR